MAVGLGSNLGDRPANLWAGVAGLEAFLAGLCCSRVYETEPVGVGDQPRFLNMCCVGRTGLDPRALLERLREIEDAAGRTRERDEPEPRTLDLDLLLYGDRVVEAPRLEVPHPRIWERAFVLVPLAEVAGTWRDPRGGRTVAEAARRVETTGVRPYGGGLPAALEEAIGR